MKKRICLFFMAMMVVLAMLCACGNKSENKNTDDEEESSTTHEGSYTDDELVMMAERYFYLANPDFDSDVELIFEINSRSEEDNTVTIHIYELSDETLATYDWYTVNIYTGKGETFLGYEIDITVTEIETKTEE